MKCLVMVVSMEDWRDLALKQEYSPEKRDLNAVWSLLILQNIKPFYKCILHEIIQLICC